MNILLSKTENWAAVEALVGELLKQGELEAARCEEIIAQAIDQSPKAENDVPIPEFRVHEGEQTGTTRDRQFFQPVE